MAKRELAPGEDTELQVDLDLRDRTGPQRFVCQLLEASGGVWTYTLETTLYKPAQFAERGSVHFGMVDPAAKETRIVEFHLHAKTTGELPKGCSFQTRSEHLRVEKAGEVVETKPGGMVVKKVHLKLTLAAPRTPGFSNANLHAEVVRGGDKQRETLGVTWNVRTFYAVEPAQVYFGTVKKGAKPVEREVVLRRVDGQPLKVTGVEAPKPCVRCTVEKSEKDGKTCKLRLVLDPKALTGPLYGEVKVRTDHPAQPVCKLPVAAILAEESSPEERNHSRKGR